jgi:uncharacterized protein (TIGR02246 family)
MMGHESHRVVVFHFRPSWRNSQTHESESHFKPAGESDACYGLRGEKKMAIERSQRPSPQSEMDELNENEIRALIEKWARAVREENRAGIRADHDPAILMFDVPPPFSSRGLDAYMATWELFFACAEKPVAFDFDDVQITAGNDVGFATATGRCVDLDPQGKRAELKFRLTMCLRKLDGRWRVVHEHHSIPAI